MGSRASAALVTPGELVAGKYRIVRLLGSGGMASVYAAVHVGLDQPVAVKVLSEVSAGDPRVVARFTREARAAARLAGDHVGRVLDVGTTARGAPFMALELLEGGDLDRYLAARGPLPVPEAVDFVLQACDGVARAHAIGIVHRDLKPSNLFLASKDGKPCVKVIDFGISKATGEDQSITQTTEVFGSPLYMSPEQVRASRDVDVRTDVWSLGVVLFELLTATRPFEGASVMALGAAILTKAPLSLRERRPDVPPELEAVVMRCLQKEPAVRWPSVLAFAEALAPFAPPDVRGLVDSMRRVAMAPPISGTARLLEEASLPSSAPGLPPGTATTIREIGETREAAVTRRVVQLLVGLAAAATLGAAGLAWWRVDAIHGARADEHAPTTATATIDDPPAPTPASAPASAAPEVAAPEATPDAGAAPVRVKPPSTRVRPKGESTAPRATSAPSPVATGVVRDRHGGD